MNKGDYVYATLIIKEDAKKEEIDKVANEYAQKLKSDYKDKKVNVQAVQGGKKCSRYNFEIEECFLGF